MDRLRREQHIRARATHKERATAPIHTIRKVRSSKAAHKKERAQFQGHKGKGTSIRPKTIAPQWSPTQYTISMFNISCQDALTASEQARTQKGRSTPRVVHLHRHWSIVPEASATPGVQMTIGEVPSSTSKPLRGTASRHRRFALLLRRRTAFLTYHLPRSAKPLIATHKISCIPHCLKSGQ